MLSEFISIAPTQITTTQIFVGDTVAKEAPLGDPRRFLVLADFLRRNFPPKRYPRVGDIAGGQGYLARALARHGYAATVIDTRRTNLSHRERFLVRARKLPGFSRCVGRFEAEAADAKFDILVGLHPDGATEALAHAAHHTPTVIVPCCNYWQGPEARSTSDVPEMIRLYWRQHRISWRETILPIQGKNIVLWTV